jgi:DNA-binding transcriptional ArsR family regulator
MGDASRWAILELLASEPLGVAAIARRIDRSIGCTSRHVAILREDGLVRVRRQGKSLSCSWPEAGSAERAILETLFAQAAHDAPPRLAPAVEAPSEAPPPVASPSPLRPAATGIPEFETYRNDSTTPRRRPSPDLDDYLL